LYLATENWVSKEFYLFIANGFGFFSSSLGTENFLSQQSFTFISLIQNFKSSPKCPFLCLKQNDTNVKAIPIEKFPTPAVFAN
jgi:hypothetical protein